jgi:peptidoglycan/xylan/chitin deacetylase (PgdA/CDA1 family)
MNHERILNHLPRKVRLTASGLLLAATISGCGSGAALSSSTASPEHSFNPVPTETETLMPTPFPTLEISPTPEPTLEITPLPTLNRTFPESSPQTIVLKPEPGKEFSHGSTNRPEMYITIDDCKSPNWDRVKTMIETAYAKGVRVTLMPAGMYINANMSYASAILKKAIEYGDEVDNHTESHPDLQNITDITFIRNEMHSQLNAVRNALGDPNFKEWFFRPPYGHGMSNEYMVKAAAQEKLAIIKWTIDTEGYLGYGVDRVLKRVFESKQFTNGAVILMHDDPDDANALSSVIDGILSRGYSLGVLSDILLEDENPNITALKPQISRVIALVVNPVKREESL